MSQHQDSKFLAVASLTDRRIQVDNSRPRSTGAAAAVVAVAVAAPLVMVAAAGSASAASTITWKSASNGLCLGYGINTFATDVATDPYLESCSAPGWTSVSWVDVNEGGGQWLEKPNVDQGLCMTAYYDHSVYQQGLDQHFQAALALS